MSDASYGMDPPYQPSGIRKMTELESRMFSELMELRDRNEQPRANHEIIQALTDEVETLRAENERLREALRSVPSSPVSAASTSAWNGRGWRCYE